MKTNIKNINTSTPAYKKIANSEHIFDADKFYSFADIARLTGVSAMGIRQRAFYDHWPLVSIFVAKGRTQRPHFSAVHFSNHYRKKQNKHTKKHEYH